MSDSTQTTVLDSAYNTGAEILDQIKNAYSSPKNCVNSYWCLIPAILLSLIGIIMLLSIYYYFMTILRSCCCCFLCKPVRRFVRPEPTVVVQPTVIPSYPAYPHNSYGCKDYYCKGYDSKELPPWTPHNAEIYNSEIHHKKANVHYNSPPERVLDSIPPQRSSHKKLLESNKHVSPMNIFYDEIPRDFSSDKPLESSSIYDKENSRDFWTDYEVESPIKDDKKYTCHRRHLSEFSINSIFGCYNDVNRQVPNDNVRVIKYDQYTDNTSYDDISNETDNPPYPPNIRDKTKDYSEF
ncbi:hypothetical protein PORY_002389 [Pneumocystis oryctolagi]|uniref:Uncharacterized protein n=1 Tax=Pneumocystis oryctolagi TaxID=42067 RepID=A0ACB7CBB5_9ASCO|nr:hypothetical protein PORY_002389 [Pneumocystis oryctolagi]